MTTQGGDDLRFDATVDLDEEAFERAFDKMVDRAVSSMVDLDRQLDKIRESLRRLSSGSEAKKFERVFVAGADGVNELRSTVREFGSQFSRTVSSARADAGELGREIDILNRSFVDTREALRGVGRSTAQLDAMESEVRQLVQLQRQYNEALERGGDDAEELGRRTRRQYELISRRLTATSTVFQEVQRAEAAALNASRTKFTVTEQAKTTALAAEGKIRALERAKELNSELLNQRRAAQRSQALLRFSLDTFGRLQRAAFQTFGNIQRLAARSIVGIGSTITGGFSRVFSRGNREVIAGGDRIERSMRSSFRRQEQIAQASFARQQSARTAAITAEVRQRSQAGVLGVGARSALFAGVGTLVGIELFRSGFERASNLERLDKQFTALLGSQERAVQLLAEIDQYARETPFDLVDVSDLAKGFLTIGTAADDILPSIDAVANAIAFTGGGNEELKRVQRALTQIASAGRLQGDELNQLAENLPGLNIRQILADQITGGDVAGLVKLQEAGELSADLVIGTLLETFRTDPRLAGATADIAETLSGRASNTREAFEAFGSAIVTRLAPAIKRGLDVIRATFENLERIVSGDLSPALRAAGIALRGVAAGLAAVIAARAAVEVFQLLGTSLRLLLTPFGAVLAIAAALGAAISLLLEYSPDFAASVGRLGEALSRLGRRVREAFIALAERLTPAFRAIGDFVADSVVPRIVAFVDAIADRLEPALASVQEFLVTRVLPAVGEFAGFLSDLAGRVVPPLAGFVTNLAAALGRLGQTVFSAVLPYLRPLAELIGGVAGALVDLLAGRGTAEALGAALSSGFQAVRDQFEPLIRDIGSAISGFFSDLIDAPGIALGVLGVIEEVAFQVVNALTDPRLLAAVAAAALAIGAALLKGIVRALIDNISQAFDELGKLAGDGLLGGILDVISNNTGKLVAVIVGAFAAVKLVQLTRQFAEYWEGLGRTAGGRFKRALIKSAAGAAAALSSIAAGQVLGTSDSAGGQLAGFGGIAASSITAGALIGGPAGLAVGAGVAGLGLLSAALSKNAEKAREAEAAISAFADAVRQAGDDAGQLSENLVEVILGRFRSQKGDVQEGFVQALRAAGFSVDSFAKAIAEGGGTLDDAVNKIVSNIDVRELKGGPLTKAAIVRFVEDIANEATAGIEQAELEAQLRPAPGLLGKVVRSLRDRLQKKIEEEGGLPEIEVPVEVVDPTISASRILGQLTEDAGELANAYDRAREAFIRLVDPEAVTANTQIRSAAGSIQSAGGSFDLSSAVGQIDFNAALGTARADIAQVFIEAAEDGLSRADASGLAGQLRSVVAEEVSDPEVAGSLLSAIDRALEGYGGLVLGFDQTAQAQRFQEVFDLLVSEVPGLVSRLDLDPTSVSAAVSAIESENPELFTEVMLVDDKNERARMIAVLIQKFQQGIDVQSLDFTAAFNFSEAQRAADAGGAQVGRFFVSGFAAGAIANAYLANNAATSVARSAERSVNRHLGIRSPSLVMRRAGRWFTAGLALGIEESIADLERIATEAATRIVEATLGPLRASQGAAASAYGQIFQGLAIGGAGMAGGAGNLAAARAALTSSFAGLLDLAFNNTKELQELRQKAADGTITPSEEFRLQLAGRATSLNPDSIFGQENRAAFARVAEDIRALLFEQLGSGASVSQVVANGRARIQEFIRLAVQAGFNEQEVLQFLRELGLSTEALQEFAEAAAELPGVVSDIRAEQAEADRQAELERAAANAPGPLPYYALPQPGQDPIPVGYQQTVNVYPQNIDTREVEVGTVTRIMGPARIATRYRT